MKASSFLRTSHTSSRREMLIGEESRGPGPQASITDSNPHCFPELSLLRVLGGLFQAALLFYIPSVFE